MDERPRDVAWEVFVFRYRLVYQVQARQIIILTFLHGARDFDRWRAQDD